MSHHWFSASDALEAGGRRAWRASEACTMRWPPLGSPLGEHTWRNHDAIMMRLMSHRWHSVGTQPLMRSSLLVAGGRRTWRAIKRGPPLGSPVKARSVSNHDAIMMCRAIVRGLSARVASKRGAAADRRACAVRGRGVTVWAAFRQPFCHIVYEAIMRQSGCNHDWGRDDQLQAGCLRWSGSGRGA